MIPSLSIKRNLTTLESLFLTVLPHGGQRSARRNAWASMSADASWARNRREADAAVEGAQLRARARELTAH
ncbi:MAG: hypothetical protein JWP14_2705 [Frankiales bacterium]|nr:hypothetical protein [Frankiales bacterium]